MTYFPTEKIIVHELNVNEDKRAQARTHFWPSSQITFLKYGIGKKFYLYKGK